MPSVSIRFTKTGTHISARGKAAQSLFDALTKELRESQVEATDQPETTFDCGSCPNITFGCVGKCMKTEVV